MRLCGCVPTTKVFHDDTLKLSYPWLNMVNEKVEMGSLREEIMDSERRLINTELVDEVISRGIKRAVFKKETPVNALSKIRMEINQLISGK